MHHQMGWKLLLISIAGSALGNAVFAQLPSAAASADSTDSLAEIVVTATKREQSTQAIPAAITAISGDVLAEKGEHSLTDLNATVPGLQVGPNNGDVSISLRGVGHNLFSPAAENSVALHLDGVYLGNAAAGQGAFFDVDRVEVLRGPQGTLYGRNATGGAINVISASPTDDFSGHVSATAGNYETSDIEAVVSGPLVQDTVSGRIGVFYNRRGDGFGHNLYNGDPLDNLNEGGAKVALLIKPDERLRIMLRGDFYGANDSNGLYQFVGEVRQPFPGAPSLSRALGTTFVTNPRDQDSEVTNSRHTNLSGASVQIDYKLNDSLSIKSLSAYRHTVSAYLADLDASPLPISGPLDLDEISGQESEELQLNWRTNSLYVVSGAYFFNGSSHSSIDINSYLSSGIPTSHIPAILPPPFGVFDQIGRTMGVKAGALYTNADWSVTDRMTLGAGLRYSDESKSNVGSEVAFFPNFVTYPKTGYVVVDESRRSHAVTPRFTADFELTSNMNLYGSVSKGFKSGEFIAGTDQYAKPEFVWAYEAGVKGTGFDHHMRGSLGVFYYDYRDLQVQRLLSPLTFLDNVPKGILKGIETEGTILLPAQFAIDGNATYLDTRMIGFSSQDPNVPGNPTRDLTGNRFPYAPTWNVNLGIEKKIGEAAFGQGALRADYQFTSDTFFDVYNSKGTNFRPAYHLLNASYKQTFNGNNWSILLWGKNLTNKVVYLNTTTNKTPNVLVPHAASSLEFANLNEPRTYGITVRYLW
jgi:iron complex outermembrane recepter protein